MGAVKIDSKRADKVDATLLDVKNALEKGHDLKEVKGPLSSLPDLINYDHEQNPVDTIRIKNASIISSFNRRNESND